MSSLIRRLKPREFPAALREIPEPPKTLYISGHLLPSSYIYLCVVGSRRHTSYGRDICEKLIAGLKGYPIVIVSGLAIGIDSLAHRAALRAGLPTMSFPGSGLDPTVLYPRSNAGLAEEIIENGGCLISEYEPHFKSERHVFRARNRLMAGISKATLIIEAEERSGTLITARMALDYNRDVLAVPGSIFSSCSQGPNDLIRQGAMPVTSSRDILEALGFDVEEVAENKNNACDDCSPEEKKILDLLREPLERDEVIRKSGMNIKDANAVLSSMEIKGMIREESGEIRRI